MNIDMKTLDLISCCGALGDETLDHDHAEGTAAIFNSDEAATIFVREKQPGP